MNVKPNTDKAAPVDDLRSHHLRPRDMPWQKLRFPGCEMKTLLFDPKSGMATMLFKMAPGAVLPDHEHVLIEQTYVLEGSLVDKEGPDAGIEVGARRIRLASGRQPARGLEPEGRLVSRHVPDPQQVLRTGRPRGRCRRQGLAIGLGRTVIEID